APDQNRDPVEAAQAPEDKRLLAEGDVRPLAVQQDSHLPAAPQEARALKAAPAHEAGGEDELKPGPEPGPLSRLSHGRRRCPRPARSSARRSRGSWWRSFPGPAPRRA